MYYGSQYWEKNLRIVDNDSPNCPLRFVPRKVLIHSIPHWMLSGVQSPTAPAVTLACLLACWGTKKKIPHRNQKWGERMWGGSWGITRVFPIASPPQFGTEILAVYFTAISLAPGITPGIYKFLIHICMNE